MSMAIQLGLTYQNDDSCDVGLKFTGTPNGLFLWYDTLVKGDESSASSQDKEFHDTAPSSNLDVSSVRNLFGG